MVNSISRGPGLPVPGAAEGGRGPAPADPATRAAGSNRTFETSPLTGSRRLDAIAAVLAADLAAAPPVETARVEALRLAIAAGSYRADPERIADAMIAHETAGLTPPR